MGGDEDEGEDQRHHYVIMEAAALIRPKKIALQNTAHKCNPYFTVLPGIFAKALLLALFGLAVKAKCLSFHFAGQADHGHFLSRSDDCLSSHIRDQSIRNAHRAVTLLVVFKDCQPRAPHGESAAVQGVNELSFGFSLRAIANVCSTCLEVFEI